MSSPKEHSKTTLDERRDNLIQSPKQIVCTSKSLMTRFDVAPFPMCVSKKALDAIRDTVGTFPPETGGKLFGPIDKMGIDLFEFDEQGSSAAGAAVYAPNTEWGKVRRDHHIMHGDPLRLWWGDVHSHPGGSNTPSGEAGHGLGDLGYARQVFAQNEAIQWFFMPIINHNHEKVFISPYIISRNNPTTPLIAPTLTVCAVEDFPEAEFPVRFQLSTIAHKIDNIANDMPDSGPEQNAVDNLSLVVDQVVALQEQISRNAERSFTTPEIKEVVCARKWHGNFTHRFPQDTLTIVQRQYVQTGILIALFLLAIVAMIFGTWQSNQLVLEKQPGTTVVDAPAQQLVPETDGYVQGAHQPR